MNNLKKRDIALIKCLRNNSRLSLTQISKQTKIPISTLFDKLKTHEQSTIEKHTTLLNFQQLGFHTKVQFYLKAPCPTREKLEAYLREHDSINSLYQVNNGFNLLAEGVFETMRRAEEFLGQLEEKFQPLEYNTHYIIKDIKREKFFAS